MYLCIKNSGPCSGLGPRSSHSWPRPRAGPCRAAKGVDRAVLAGHKVGVGGARGTSGATSIGDGERPADGRHC
jgi:hypothetical protein